MGFGTSFCLAATLFAAAGVEKIGILSDTHVGLRGDTAFTLVEKSYRLFKAKGVTHVFNIGDIANTHNPAWYGRYAAISKAVYPEGVHEVFVYHNHDRMKFPGPDDKFATKAFAAVKEALGASNDRYARFEIAGHPFLVYPQFVDLARMEREIAAEVAARPGRPVFVLDHEPPFATVDGSIYGGRAAQKKIFSKFPEVVAFSGHVHGSVTNELKIWQGAFTAVGFGDFNESVGPDGDAFVSILELSNDRAVIRRYSALTGREYAPEAPWTIDFPYDPKNPRYPRPINRKVVSFTPAELAAFRPVTEKFPVTAADSGETKGSAHITVDFTMAHRGDHPGCFEILDTRGRPILREKIPLDDGTFHFELDARFPIATHPASLIVSGASRENLIRINTLTYRPSLSK